MELLAPAGNWDAFLGAINNGADAVYVGGRLYSARQSAANFDDQTMQAAIEYAHLRRKKVYAAVNTLIDNTEMSAVLDYLYSLQQFGIDAVIVQDVGLLTAIRKSLPHLRIHASTQMTIHNSNGVTWLKEAGVQRVVLAREMNLAEISAINQQVPGMELEVFVHGAICYSYSGQCLFSSMVGGRSGNRGKCAQPCRLPYNLLSCSTRNKIQLTDHGNYLLSPADLCLIEYLTDLKTAGVTSIKIEGRMKRAEYVAVVTRNYRQVLDRLDADAGFKPGPEYLKELLNIFNRNFSGGHIIPDNHEFLSTRRPNNRGVQVGRVLEQNRNLVTRIKLSDTVKLGDGLVIWVSQGNSPAFTLREIIVEGKKADQAEPGQIIEVQLESRVFATDRVFKTHDEELLASTHASLSPDYDKLPVDMEVVLKTDEPLSITVKDSLERAARTETSSLAIKAEQQPLDLDKLHAKLGRLGNTLFRLRSLTLEGEPDLIVPFSEINDARRRATDILKNSILEQTHPEVENSASFILAKNEFLTLAKPAKKRLDTRLSVAVSTIDDAMTALQQGADIVYLGLEGMANHRRIRPDELDLIKAYVEAGRIIPLLPRINKPGDSFDYHQQARQMSSAVMVANWGDLDWGLKSGLEVSTDVNLNVFNSFSYRYLTEKGVNLVGLSPELNFNQLEKFPDLSQAELIVQGDLILMQAEYCMLGGVLDGAQQKCMAPCGRNQYYIKDGKGFEFPLATDADCRMYVFNSRTLCMLEDLNKILKLGPSAIRIEARLSHGESLGSTVAVYRTVIDRLANGDQPDLSAYRESLERFNKSPATKGHYYRGVL